MRVSAQPHARATGLPPLALPSGWSYLFDASSADGVGNRTIGNHSQVSTWDSQGSLGDATQATAAAQPMLRKRWIGRCGAASFDGVSDFLTVASSQADLAFLHTTGVFDVVMVLRKSAATQGVIFGSANGATEKGFRVVLDNSAGNDRVTFYLYNGATAIFTAGLAYSIALGAWTAVEFVANGTHFGGSYTVQATAASLFANGLGVGDATNVARLGMNAAGINPYCGDLALLVVYPRVLDEATEKAAIVRPVLNARYGLGLP